MPLQLLLFGTFLAFVFREVESVRCYNCASTQFECATGICNGAWCVEQIIFSEGRFFSSKICHEVNLLPSQSEGCVKDQMDGVTSITCNCQSEFCNDADKLRSFPEMRELPLIPRDSNYTVARNLTDNFNVSSTSTNTTDFNSTENQNAIASMYRTTTSTNHPYHIGSARSTIASASFPTVTSNLSSLSSRLCSYGASNEAETESGKHTCRGQWCVYHTLQTPESGFFVWMKTCADANQLGIDDDSCENSSSRSFVQIYCACRSEDLCNRQDFFLKRQLLKGIHSVNTTRIAKGKIKL